MYSANSGLHNHTLQTAFKYFTLIFKYFILIVDKNGTDPDANRGDNI